jgi:hypothetical protein
MKITKVDYSKTFNLGNYQSAKIGFEAEVEHNEDPVEVLIQLQTKVQLLGLEEIERNRGKR